MDERAKAETRDEWRELGFFYDLDVEKQEWHIAGSRAGLLRFRDLLNDYAADSRNELLSEHEHYVRTSTSRS